MWVGVFVWERDSESVLCVGVYVLLVWERMKARRGGISLQLHALIIKLSAVKFKRWSESGPLHETENIWTFHIHGAWNIVWSLHNF